MHDRCVEEQSTDIAFDRLRLPGRHAEEHLEIDPVQDAALLREQPRESQVEQVVAGHSDADSVGALRGEGPVEHALVVGVGLELGRQGRQRPAVHGGINALHRQVGALHHAHLDAGATRLPARYRPRGEPVQGRERVGQVCLQHDSRFQPAQLRLVEDPLEHLDGQIEVAELLHVEVDEFFRAG